MEFRHFFQLAHGEDTRRLTSQCVEPAPTNARRWRRHAAEFLSSWRRGPVVDFQLSCGKPLLICKTIIGQESSFYIVGSWPYALQPRGELVKDVTITFTFICTAWPIFAIEQPYDTL